MNEQSERIQIAELTNEIVAAYVSHDKLQMLDIPNLINAVATELGSLGTEATPIALERPEPAVSVRRSVLLEPDRRRASYVLASSLGESRRSPTPQCGRAIP